MPDVRQILHMIFMVDVSGSMRGQRIAMVNNALESIFSELRQRDDLHAVIKVSIMTFAEKAQWVTPNPIRLEDYVMMKLTTVPWITCYAPAFDELSRVLRRERFLVPSLGEYYAPLILFVTDGEPTDFDEYPGALSRLRRNGWFRKATKYAIATGVEAQNTDNFALLAEFTDVRENVRYAGEGWLCAAVADGHGSRKHFRSGTGAELACDALRETLERLGADAEPQMLKDAIVARWRERVRAHLAAQPFTPEELTE